jgi:hypothetical protein
MVLLNLGLQSIMILCIVDIVCCYECNCCKSRLSDPSNYENLFFVLLPGSDTIISVFNYGILLLKDQDPLVKMWRIRNPRWKVNGMNWCDLTICFMSEARQQYYYNSVNYKHFSTVENWQYSLLLFFCIYIDK